MRKYFIFSLILVIPIIYSCKEMLLTYKDSGKTITLAKGQMLKIQLPANASTGNIWRNTIYNDSIISRIGKPNYMLSDDGSVGATGTLTLRFRAINTGSSKLFMEYGSRFDINKPILKEFSLDINVVEVQ